MEAVILIGIQGSGKSTFCRQRFYDTHVRINLDMLKTRNRERLLVVACLDGKQSFVIDNTNPAIEDRARYIRRAKDYGFRIVGYYFKANLDDCLMRNAGRLDRARIPDRGVLATYKRLQIPSFDEGFDELYYVEANSDHSFAIKEWQREI